MFLFFSLPFVLLILTAQARNPPGANAQEISRDGLSLLYTAVRNGDTATAQALIADAREISPDVFSLLLRTAVTNRHMATAQVLITAGADAREIPRDGLPLLHIAVNNSDPATARVLIEAGADAQSLLTQAVLGYDFRAEEVLREAGA